MNSKDSKKKSKKKRRNRGRNRDGGLLSVMASTSALTLTALAVLMIRKGYIINWTWNLFPITLALCGVGGYLMQRRNRMTSEARIGLFMALSVLVVIGTLLLTTH